MQCRLSFRRIGLRCFEVLLIVFMGAGCGGKPPPPPLRAPAVSPPGVSYRAGAPLAMASTRPVGIAAGDALAVRSTWVALSGTPQALRPITADATLIAAPRAAEPLLAAGRLSRGARIVPAAEVDAFLANVERGRYGQRAAIGASDAALPRDVTATFALGDASRRIEVDLYRPVATTATTATATTAAIAPAGETVAEILPSEAIQLSLALDDVDSQRERVLLRPTAMQPPTRFALVLPSHFPTPGVKAIVAIIEIAPASDAPEHLQAVAACAAALRESVAQSPRSTTAPAAGWAGLDVALRAANEPATTRVAMVYLAGETGAELLGDAALVAPDATLAELAARVRQRLGDSAPATSDPAQLGWLLDAATLEHLAALQASEKMPPELAGVLARHAGEAARNAGSLEELTRVRGREQLRARLVAENFTYLEDASPSARVRAYEWLRARALAPAKYDPLGPPRERAAAVDAAMTAAAAAAAVPAAKNVTSTGGVP